MSHCNVPFPAPATQSHAPTLPGASIDCACHRMSHWCCACHTKSHCNSSLHQPPRATLQRYQDASIDCACHQMSHWCCACHNVTIQRTIPCTSHPDPHSNATRDFNRLRLPPNVTLVLRLPHSVTLQRTLPCTSHPEPRSNATRMLQSTAPATKCHTGAAPATQRHNSTYHSLHQPPRPTLQRYQGLQSTAPATKCRLPHSVTLQRTLPCTSHPKPRSNATRMLQSPATKCHTGAAPATQRHTATYMQRTIPCTSHPEPRSNATRMLPSTAPATKCHTGAAPATQRHNSTYHSLHQPHRSALQLEVFQRVQASQFHMYKRANFTCTSEPAPYEQCGQGLQVSSYDRVQHMLLSLYGECWHRTGSTSCRHACLPATQPFSSK